MKIGCLEVTEFLISHGLYGLMQSTDLLITDTGQGQVRSIRALLFERSPAA